MILTNKKKIERKKVTNINEIGQVVNEIFVYRRIGSLQTENVFISGLECF